MKTMNEIHRENLRALVAEFGSVTALALKIGVQDSQFSQWLNGSTNSGTGKPRGLGPSSARRIEKACDKPTGWMDREHQAIASTALVEPSERMFYDWISAEEAEHLTNLRTSDEIGRKFILNTGRDTTKVITPATTKSKG